MTTTPSPCTHTRRNFLGACLSCGSYVALSLAAGGVATRKAFAGQDRTADGAPQPELASNFARINKLSDGVWSVVSTPGDNAYQTVSNGGIIQGNNLTVAIEGFNSTDGAAWVSGACKALTGKHPDYIILTHLHGDHTNGLAGYLSTNNNPTPPKFIATTTTRTIMADRAGTAEAAAIDPQTGLPTLAQPSLLPDVLVPDTNDPTTLDLGGKTLQLTPRSGHSPSDLEIKLLERNTIWTGDLVFNGMFPYFGDATPSKLTAACKDMLSDKDATYIPGHGPVANYQGLRTYLELLAHVEDAAKEAHRKGLSPDEAWQTYTIPQSLGDWGKFRPDVYRFAFEAWHKELTS